MLLNKTFIGSAMFFVGCGIGLMMNVAFQHVVDRYDNGHLTQMLIGISQLVMISFIVYFFQESVNTMGLFITGILMAQELYIMKILPKSKKRVKEEEQK
jgi:Ca2+/Na+ antiporter